MKWYGGIEAGGTKFNCIIARDPDHVLAETTIQTKSPDETIPDVIKFFEDSKQKLGISLSSLGVASFGPVNLSVDQPGYGTITSSPKIQWQNTPLLDRLKVNFNIPIMFDTDVNGAAIGEGKWGAGKGLSDFVYVTIGTGIGGGIITNGLPVHGLIHPELGHMVINHDRTFDPFEGICPFHHDCLEGLASGPAMTKRWGIPTQDLPETHSAWDLEAYYLGQAIHNLCLVCSPKRIILGGGVMKKPGLIEKIRLTAQSSLNGYIESVEIKNNIDAFIVAPALGDRAGVFGAIALASLAFST